MTKDGYRPGWLVPAAMLLGAAALRFLYFWVYARHLPFLFHPFGDAEVYLDWSRRIAEGAAPAGVFYRAPLYPYVVALFLKAGLGLWPVYVVQSALGLGTLLLIYLSGLRLFNRAAATIALALAALCAPFMFFETKLLSATLVVFLLTLGTFLVIGAAERRRRWLWLPSGVCFGLAAIAWAGALVPFAVLCLWAELSRAAGRKAVPLGMLGCIAVVSVVTIRNAASGSDFVPVSANAGFTFYQGNNRLAAGTLALPPEVYETKFDGRYLTDIAEQEDFEQRYATQQTGRQLRASQVSAFWFRRAIDWIADQPGAYLVLLGRKLVLSLSNYESPSDYNLELEQRKVWPIAAAFVGFGLLLALSVAGLFAAREKASWPLYALTLGVFASLLVFYVADRYRLPLYPALAVLAGAGVHKLWRAARLHKLRVLPVAAGVFTLLLSLVAFTVPLRRGSNLLLADACRNLADVYQFRTGDTGKAEAAYAQAIALYEPNVNRASLQERVMLAQARLMLARLYDGTGRTDLAVQQVEQVRALNTGLGLPAIADPVASARSALGQADTTTAIAVLSGALERDSTSRDAWLLLGSIYGTRRDASQALSVFTRAIAHVPDDPALLYNCALAALDAGDNRTALACAERLQQLVPDNPPAKALAARARSRLAGQR